MTGSKAGGLKAAATNKLRNGADFYARIGRIGGKVCVKKGFAMNPDLAKRAGAIGGKLSKRGANKK